MLLPDSTTSMRVAEAATRQRPLGGGAALSWRPSACIRVRLPDAACRACIDICPVGALRGTAGAIELAPSCTGCGRCQAVCPTAALAADGFDEADAALAERAATQAGSSTLAIECLRARAARGNDDVVHVPCLGGMSPGRLAQWCVQAGARPLVLVERGLCAACDSGRTQHPARATLEHLVPLLRTAGVPEARLPRIEQRPSAARAHHEADPMQRLGRARRGFFAAVARGGARASPSVDVSPHDAQPHAPRASTAERRRLVGALRTLAARHGGQMPASLFPRIEVSDTCVGHRICAATCPTGALGRYRDDAHGHIGLTFDATDCIGCAHCVAACPERALALRCGAGTPQRLAITRIPQRECRACGSRFAARDDDPETCCPGCRKSRFVAQAAFRALVGACAVTPNPARAGCTTQEELR